MAELPTQSNWFMAMITSEQLYFRVEASLQPARQSIKSNELSSWRDVAAGSYMETVCSLQNVY